MNAEKQIANVLAILVAVAAYGAAAQLSINFPEGTAVAPITGQTLAILIASRLLGWKKAGFSVLLYLILGLIGLPVFSNFSSGLNVLLGPSIGYFIGFLVAATVVGKIGENTESRFTYYLLEFLLGTLIILLIGAFGLVWFLPLNEIFAKGVLPFLPGAVIKITLGAILLYVFAKAKKLFKKF